MSHLKAPMPLRTAFTFCSPADGSAIVSFDANESLPETVNPMWASLQSAELLGDCSYTHRLRELQGWSVSSRLAWMAVVLCLWPHQVPVWVPQSAEVCLCVWQWMRRRYFVFHEGVAEVTLFAHWTAVNELNAAFLDDLGRFTTDEERLTYLKAFSTERRKTPSGYRRTRQKRRLMVRKTSDMINMIDRGEMS